ncbi:Hypothetical predicted protein, partial [Pelobates cultripes]
MTAVHSNRRNDVRQYQRGVYMTSARESSRTSQALVANESPEVNRTVGVRESDVHKPRRLESVREAASTERSRTHGVQELEEVCLVNSGDLYKASQEWACCGAERRGTSGDLRLVDSDTQQSDHHRCQDSDDETCRMSAASASRLGERNIPFHLVVQRVEGPNSLLPT